VPLEVAFAADPAAPTIQPTQVELAANIMVAETSGPAAASALQPRSSEAIE